MATDTFSPPDVDEYNEYYHRYVSLVDGTDFLNSLSEQVPMLRDLLGGLSAETESMLHPPYTWTLKQVLGHLIDCERVFSTRLLRIGVGDPAPLPGMDQDVYAANLSFENVTMQNLLDEFAHLRQSSVLLAQRMSAENLANRGVASDWPVSAKANLFILAGHVEYHAIIMRNRLGVAS